VSGISARLRAPITGRVDLGAVLAGGWGSLDAGELARRPIAVDGESVPLGELFEVTGSPGARFVFSGDLTQADRVAAGLSEGEVVVEGNAGDEAGIGMAGGSLDIRGDAGARAGGAEVDARRGMTGGELVIRGKAGPGPGGRMRRGLVVVAGDVASEAGPSMIAGTLMVFGQAGTSPGRWSKRGSIVALGPVDIPPTYRYACTYQPAYLQLILRRLERRYGLPVEARHQSGHYRRYSGDLAELGKGEILAWTAD